MFSTEKNGHVTSFSLRDSQVKHSTDGKEVDDHEKVPR